MKGIPWHVFPTAFSSCPSALSRDLSPTKTQNGFGYLIKLRLWGLTAKIHWESKRLIRGRLVNIQREAPTLQGTGHEMWPGLVLQVGWIHMLMSERIILAIGEPPTPPSFDSALELSCHLCVCVLAYRLEIKVYLNLTCHLGPNWF